MGVSDNLKLSDT